MKRLNTITDVPGIKVGHASDFKALTGYTVILCEEGAVGAVDIRGTATGTREIDALSYLHLVKKIHAILLTGGSAFGLDAAGGDLIFAISLGKKRGDANTVGLLGEQALIESVERAVTKADGLGVIPAYRDMIALKRKV